MIARIVLSLLSLIWAVPLFAACAGTDLRGSLTETERAHVAEATADAPFTEGNHWRATRDGKTLHLIGTMHLADPRLDAPVERLAGVVEAADLLLLEMTQDDQDALQSRLATDSSLLLLPDTSLPELLSEEDWQKMSKALSDRGLPPFVASRFQPWYVSMLLAIPACASLEDLSSGGMDSRLEAVAAAAGVPRMALEDSDTIFKTFAEQPRDMQIDMMLSALTDPQQSEDMFATLLASYFDEAHAEGWAVSSLLALRYSPIDKAKSAEILRVMEETLLDQRNRAWLPVLLAALEDHDTVVAAFGAAHLSGAAGVPALLEAEGFTLERLAF